MPRMTNAKSVSVLDETDAFERKMRWQEFQAENEAVLYGDYTGWQPGKPLMSRTPRYDEWDDIDIAASLVDPTVSSNVARPMVDILHDKSFLTARCEDCEVTWWGSDPCFICGKTVVSYLTNGSISTVKVIEYPTHYLTYPSAMAEPKGELEEVLARLDRPAQIWLGLTTVSIFDPEFLRPNSARRVERPQVVTNRQVERMHAFLARTIREHLDEHPAPVTFVRSYYSRGLRVGRRELDEWVSEHPPVSGDDPADREIVRVEVDGVPHELEVSSRDNNYPIFPAVNLSIARARIHRLTDDGRRVGPSIDFRVPINQQRRRRE